MVGSEPAEPTDTGRGSLRRIPWQDPLGDDTAKPDVADSLQGAGCKETDGGARVAGRLSQGRALFR